MANLFYKTQEAFGLDVSAGSLKILQFTGDNKESQVKAFTEVSLPKGIIVNDAFLDVKTFSHLLQEALQKPQFGKISTPYAIVSLPESKSFVRVIQIPIMGEQEAENAIPFEAESFIPLPIGQVYLDWQILNTVNDKMNVLIIASPKDFVDSYLGILEKCGVVPAALEVESLSCHRALINPENKENQLIVDISANRTSLIMIESGNLQFTSTIPLAGNNFTESIARGLGVSAAKAEVIKQAVGMSNVPEYPNVKTALLPSLNGLVAEIKNVLRFNFEHSGSKVNKMVVTGGSARLKNIVSFLQAEFLPEEAMSVELANPWQNVKGFSAPPISPENSLGLSTVIGLAIRGKNYNE